MNKDIKKYADMLYEAERTREPIGPLTEMDPTLDIDDAYAIQLANVNRVIEEGHVTQSILCAKSFAGILKIKRISSMPSNAHRINFAEPDFKLL